MVAEEVSASVLACVTYQPPPVSPALLREMTQLLGRDTRHASNTCAATRDTDALRGGLHAPLHVHVADG